MTATIATSSHPHVHSATVAGGLACAPIVTGADVKSLFVAIESRCRFASTRFQTCSRPPHGTGPAWQGLVATGNRLVLPRDSLPDPAAADALGEPITFFHSLVLPSVSLWHLAKHFCDPNVTGCDLVTAAAAAVLFSRFEDGAEMPVTALMMHRLFIACVHVAAKCLQDDFPSNALTAARVGMALPEVNRIELTLLESLGWSANVTAEDVQELVACRVYGRPSKATLALAPLHLNAPEFPLFAPDPACSAVVEPCEANAQSHVSEYTAAKANASVTCYVDCASDSFASDSHRHSRRSRFNEDAVGAGRAGSTAVSAHA